MLALVLGGNGFIGSHVVDELLRLGHGVRVFDRRPEEFREPLPRVDYRRGDFSDIFAVSEALEGVDWVFHLVSTTVPGTSNLDPVSDIQSNLVGSVNLFRAMVESGVRRILFLSSGGTVYGVPERIPIPEEHPLRPICSYGVVKVAIENYLTMFERLHGLTPVVLRPSNPYGPRQGRHGVQGVIATFLRKLCGDQELSVWGDGSVRRDYVYIQDLARLCVAAASSDKGGVFNAGSGISHSINELLALLGRITGREPRVRHAPARPFDVADVALDISRAKAEFDWLPAVDLRDGLARTFRWAMECHGPTGGLDSAPGRNNR